MRRRLQISTALAAHPLLAVVFAGSVDTLLAASLRAQPQPLVWKQKFVTGPSPRTGHAMAYDSGRGVTVLFGGCNCVSGAFSGETWEWNGSTWTMRSAIGPTPRSTHAMAYDGSRGVVTLFGGYNNSAGANPHLVDTWEWNGASWTQRTSAGPPGWFGQQMTFDSTREVGVLFQYAVQGSGGGGQTWLWNGTTWSQRTATGPTGRVYAGIAFDTSRALTVLFGGHNQDGLPTRWNGDTWEWNGTAWSQRATTGPSPRYGLAMAFHMTQGATLLFGGLGDINGPAHGDTWRWDGTGVWNQLLLPGPSPRGGHSMVYDTARDVIVLFGGGTGVGVLNGETWELAVCPPDFNHSGAIEIQDVFDLLSAWFAGDTRADFNHVNGLTQQDLFDFLSAWFAGC